MEEQAPRNNTDDPAAALPPLPPPPGRHGHGHDTYIVQFPKDQVYRVPPPENALIVEQYRNPTTEKKRRRCCCFCSRRFLLTLAIIVVAVVAIAGITLATLFFVFKPKAPGFTVSHVAVRGHKNSEYEVSLRVKNPNGRLGIGYENGDVSLLFRETKAATGKFPTLKQRRDESSEVEVELTGSNGPLPKSDRPVDLKLEMELRVRVTAAGLKTWVMRSNVGCELKVSGLGNDTRILSQECHAKLK